MSYKGGGGGLADILLRVLGKSEESVKGSFSFLVTEGGGGGLADNLLLSLIHI